jgi:hypothetical protein
VWLKVGENFGKYSILRTAAVFAGEPAAARCPRSTLGTLHRSLNCQALRLVEDDTAAILTHFLSHSGACGSSNRRLKTARANHCGGLNVAQYRSITLMLMSAQIRPTFILLACLLAFSVLPNAFAREIRGKPISRSAKTNVTASGVAVLTNLPTASVVPTKTTGDYLEVGFDQLAGYTFEVPEGVQPTNAVETKAAGQIPVEVKAFDQKKVAVKGFMLPLKVDDGVVTEMLIMKDQSMCCYGSVPRINDWVSVKMKNGGVKSVMDQPVTLYGKLKVGEMLENGYLVGIYQMEGDKMDEPKD